jgi:hypothetical protein
MTYCQHKGYCHVKIHFSVTAKSDKDPNPDLHWFGSLFPNPHWDGKLDPDPHGNQCGSTALVTSNAVFRHLHVTAGIRAAGLSTVAPGADPGALSGALPGALSGAPRWPGAGATGGFPATRPLPAAHVN